MNNDPQILNYTANRIFFFKIWLSHCYPLYSMAHYSTNFMQIDPPFSSFTIGAYRIYILRLYCGCLIDECPFAQNWCWHSNEEFLLVYEHQRLLLPQRRRRQLEKVYYTNLCEALWKCENHSGGLNCRASTSLTCSFASILCVWECMEVKHLTKI